MNTCTNKSYEQVALPIKQYCERYPWHEASETMGKVIVSLYTAKHAKWNVNFHDIFLLDEVNYQNLTKALNIMYATNMSPSTFFGQDFITDLIHRYG
jgi:hypothetical protein